MSELVHVKGLSDLQRFLDALPPKIEKNVLRGSLRAGISQAILPAARANIRSVSGKTSKSLKVRTDARGGQVTASLYTKLYTARFLEYGTKPHIIRPKNGKALAIGGLFVAAVEHPGARATGFMRRALDTRAKDAVVAAAEYMKTRLATKYGLDTAGVEIGDGE
jgi:hypothetical protein